MKTLILLSVTGSLGPFPAWQPGLYYRIEDGDFSRFDGIRQQRNNGLTLDRELDSLIFREPNRFSAGRMLRREWKLVKKFPTDKVDAVVHLECWV